MTSKATGYLDFPAHMQEFGKFVFLRTYSRWLEDEKRRETFYEMAQRVAKYNASTHPSLLSPTTISLDFAVSSSSSK